VAGLAAANELEYDENMVGVAHTHIIDTIIDTIILNNYTNDAYIHLSQQVLKRRTEKIEEFLSSMAHLVIVSDRQVCYML
jgi:proteasome assembly chaperone (PAC2) family protein